MIGAERRRSRLDRVTSSEAVQAPPLRSAPGASRQAETRRAQQLRLRRLGLAVIGYGALMAVISYLWWDGQLFLSAAGLVSIWGGLAVFNLVLAAVIWSGRNLPLSDPSMTAMQTLALIILLLVIASLSQTVTAQDACAMAIEVGLLFGMFHLGWRGLTALAAVGFVGFSVIAVRSAPALGLGSHITVARLVVVGGVLAWTSFFASYVGGLRARLRSRNSELRTALARLDEMIRHDGLTGILNRAEVLRQLDEVMAEGLRAGLPVSVSMFDLDHFKRINDTYGHSAGDEVLCEFVRRVKASARAIDRLGRVADGHGFGRFGGEEFLLVMPVTSLGGAREAAERIRAAIADQAFSVDGHAIPVTVSQGVAQAERGEDLRALLVRADEALYQAKRAGRNRVMIADSPEKAQGMGEQRHTRRRDHSMA